MKILVLTPGVEARVIAPDELDIDGSGASRLTWIDLQREEVPRLAAMELGLPPDVVRGLIDHATSPALHRRGSLVTVSLLGVSGAAGGRELTDVDVVQAPGLLLTVHSRDCPALERLVQKRLWPASSASAATGGLATVVAAVVDAYDGIVSDAEREVELLVDRRAGRSSGRAQPGDFLRLRRRLINLRHQVMAERDIVAELARSFPAGETSSPIQTLPDRLESALAAIDMTAEYAIGQAWSWGATRRRRDLLSGLLGAWSTFATILALAGLARLRSASSALDPSVALWTAVGLIAFTSFSLLFAWLQRWR